VTAQYSSLQITKALQAHKSCVLKQHDRFTILDGPAFALLLEKLEVRSRTEAVAAAFGPGIVEAADQEKAQRPRARGR
jgi:hypothetical protein